MPFSEKQNSSKVVALKGLVLPDFIVPEIPAKLLKISPEMAAWRDEINANWNRAKEALRRRDLEIAMAANDSG